MAIPGQRGVKERALEALVLCVLLHLTLPIDAVVGVCDCMRLCAGSCSCCWVQVSSESCS